MKVYLIASLLLCLTLNFTFAQDQTNAKRSQFGISTEFNISNASVKTIDLPIPGVNDGITAIDARSRPGFGLGIMYRYRLNDLLVARAQGVLSFTEQAFLQEFTRRREMVNLEFPLHLVFEKANKKVAPAAFIGGRYRIDLAADKYPTNIQHNTEIFQRQDILMDIGFGVAFEMQKFTFKPELMYSRGLLNQAGEIDIAFENLYSNQFSLRLSFYGS